MSVSSRGCNHVIYGTANIVHTHTDLKFNRRKWILYIKFPYELMVLNINKCFCKYQITF